MSGEDRYYHFQSACKELAVSAAWHIFPDAEMLVLRMVG
jgi:hypothetical protein